MTDTASHSLSLDELLTYARCPLEWYWEWRLAAAKPYTPNLLIQTAVRQALSDYYAGHADSVGAGVGLVWRDWCEAWGDPGIAEELALYQGGRARILAEFEKGNITRPDGSLYVVPQMTNEYRSRMHRAGLLKISLRLDEFAATHGIVLGLGGAELGETSGLGDAYADCVHIAERMLGRGGRALPAREVALGTQVAYQVALGAFHVAGQADLVVEAGPKSPAGDRAVVLEVHDYKAIKLSPGAAARDLRVIAASLSQSAEGASAEWGTVEHVAYRHMRSGQTFATRSGQTDPGRLLAVVAAVARGMRSGVVVPRALSNPFDCRSCAYHPRCFAEEGWDTVDLVDVTATAQAERLARILQRVKASLSGDGRVAEQTRRALTAIEQGIREELPELDGALEILLEAGATISDTGQ